MSTYKRGRELRETEFNKLKPVVDYFASEGKSNKFIGEQIRRSSTTAWMIRNSNDFAEYTARNMARHDKTKKGVKQITLDEAISEKESVVFNEIVTLEMVHKEVLSLRMLIMGMNSQQANKKELKPGDYSTPHGIMIVGEPMVIGKVKATKNSTFGGGQNGSGK